MRRIFERFQDQKSVHNDTELSDIIDNKEEYQDVDFDDAEYLKNIQKYEHEKAKLWLKNDFQSHLRVYAKQKYDKTINITKASAYRVYKRMYEDKIKNNNSLTLYDKVLYHPDLTKLDYDFITEENSKVFRNTGIGGGISISILGYSYFLGKLKNSRFMIPILMFTPGVSLFFTYKAEQYRLIHKLRRLQFQSKYDIPNQ